MFDGGMIMPFNCSLKYPPMFVGNVNKNKPLYRTRFNPSMAINLSSILLQSDEGEKLPQSKRISRCHTSNPLLTQANTVGIIGGVSVFSTLIFLEKLVWFSSRDGQQSIPFVVCSDPAISRDLLFCGSFPHINGKEAQFRLNCRTTVENLRDKRAFLEQSGARCIVMPCHVSHAWLVEVSTGCSVPFHNLGDCVAMELKEAKLKPLETGSNVRIGVLTANGASVAGFYQEKLQNQGFEVVLPDKATMEHIVIPAIEALNRKDTEGAKNLLTIAIHILLVRAVNYVILASDKFQGLWPHDDPLLKKCIDPMDALARFTINWAQSTEKLQKQTSK